MSKFKIDLTTGDKFWTPKGLGALGMDPNRAIAELVANSLDWRKEGKEKTIITIRIGNGFIEITDNGVGMTKAELQNAIKVSVANDDIRPNIRVRKGMFGMGMKVACLTLGWKITFITRSISESNLEHSVILDTKRLDGSDKNYRNNILGETTSFKSNSPLGDFESGTAIKIENLTYKSLVGVSVRDSLEEVFKPELGIENIEIKIIDEKREEEFLCEKPEVSIIEGSKIDLDELNLYVNVKDSNKRVKIKGWIGLMSISRPGGNWGLHLFKNNQIIERYHQLPQRLGGLMPKNPHSEVSRTYGEIELDMCYPAFHKVGFDHSTFEWEQVQKLLEPHLLVVMKASENYKKSDIEKSAETVNKIQKHKRASKKVAELLKEHIEDPEKPDGAFTLNDGRWFTIVPPIFKELNDLNSPWIYNYSKNSHELLIIINTKSPIYIDALEKGLDDNLLSMITNWAISDSVFFLLIEEFNYMNGDALNIRNNIVVKLYKSSGDGR